MEPQDIVDNNDSDAPGVQADAVQIGAGIAPEDIRLKREGADLRVAIAGTDDVLRVSGYFTNDGNSAFVVEALRFADGTVWDYATVRAKVLAATADDDTISGGLRSDLIGAGQGRPESSKALVSTPSPGCRPNRFAVSATAYFAELAIGQQPSRVGVRHGRIMASSRCTA